MTVLIDRWLPVATVGVVALLVVLVAFQVALALGAPWGAAAYGGAHDGVLPANLRVASAVAAVVWSGAGVLLANRAGWSLPAPVPHGWVPTLTWVVLAVLVVGVVLNAITRSATERAIWLPVTVLLTLGTLVIALSPKP